MVTRITNQVQQANALRNIFRITEDLFKANERVATGKRINKPSDDPTGIRDSLGLRSALNQTRQFRRNIENNDLFVESADSALDSVGLSAIRVRELALGALSGTDTAETRGFAAVEIATIIEEVFQAANTKVENRFIFSGTRLLVDPFRLDTSGSGAVYTGNSESFNIEVAPGQTVPITRPGSEMFATDLNPILNGANSIADLNGGSGVVPGSFSITDRSGNNATINITAGMTVTNVLAAINGAGLNITASLNTSGNGLLLSDSSTLLTNSLTVAEIGSGTTANSLGILGKVDGPLEGRDLNPQVTATTLLSDLDAGQGLILDQINIVNGAASGTITLSTATTVGDVLTQINSAGLNVTASLNGQANSLRVISNSASSAAIVRNVSGGNTATILGLGGGRNVFVAFEKVKEALDKDDTQGILASLDTLEDVLKNIGNSRSDYGAVLRRLNNTQTFHETDIVNQERQLSTIEDSDVTREASNIQLLDFALQATLNTSARILQPSLLDFLS